MSYWLGEGDAMGSFEGGEQSAMQPPVRVQEAKMPVPVTPDDEVDDDPDAPDDVPDEAPDEAPDDEEDPEEDPGVDPEDEVGPALPLLDDARPLASTPTPWPWPAAPHAVPVQWSREASGLGVPAQAVMIAAPAIVAPRYHR